MNFTMTSNPEYARRLFESSRALFIGAHPDDIEFYCGGLVYELTLAGVNVEYLIATRGGRGLNGRLLRYMEKTRVKQQVAAANILSVLSLKFLDFPDKRLSSHIDELSDKIKDYIREQPYDMVFSWDPDYIFNPHPDHMAVAEAARSAMHGMTSRLLHFGTRKPNLHIGLVHYAYSAKIRSIRAHRTETPCFYWPVIKRQINNRLVSGGREIGCQYAESFRKDPPPSFSVCHK